MYTFWISLLNTNDSAVKRNIKEMKILSWKMKKLARYEFIRLEEKRSFSLSNLINNQF